MAMEFDWDERKRALNLEKHGLDFADVASLAWETARVLGDDRRDYGEVRYRAVAFTRTNRISWPSPFATRRYG